MTQAPFRLFDHVDLRVHDLAAARAFYDPLLRAFGLRGRRSLSDEGSFVYLRINEKTAHEAFALIADATHVPNAVGIAFAAATREDVDRIAAIAAAAPGVRDYEAPHECREYAESYYAVFFRDPSGKYDYGDPKMA